ncbi:MAG: GNAT family N-acetyltransferase [Geminicoccaceae bacterium]
MIDDRQATERRNEIQISPSHQSQGIGTKLIVKVMDETTTSGLPVLLRVLTENRARALYERLGFKGIGMYGHTHYWLKYTPIADQGRRGGFLM